MISQLFVVTFVHPIYVQIALIWDFTVQLSLWQVLSNTSLIVWICLAVYEISANKTFTVTDSLISCVMIQSSKC